MLSFSPFRIDLESERVWRRDEELHLRRKPFAILRHLVQNPQRLVTHAEIIEVVWGKVSMSESLLRTHIHDLRQALGDGVVETLPGRGYRFIADIKPVDDASRDPRLPEPVCPVEPFARAVVGRDSEVDALSAALRAVGEGRRAAVFVVGEAGVGKTTLVDSFLLQAAAQGVLLVGRGACVEQYGSGQAYLPVLDAIGALCRGRGGERAIEVLTRHAPAWLAQLPGLLRSDRLEEAQRRAAGATQARVLREIAEALEALSAEAPVVMVFEDLQWTDPSTAELLAILSSRREPARLLVVGTYRPAEVARGHALTKVVGELVAHRRASSIALEGFGLETLDAYLGRRFPAHRFPQPLVGALHRATGGNPLFVTTLLDDLEGQGVIRERDGGWELSTSVEEVAARRPDGISRLIDTQIDRLTAVEQRVLEVASVAGISFTVGVVAYALEADSDGVDSCCEALAGDRGLLQYLGTETWPDGTIQPRYGFRHALFQHATLARSPAAKIRGWHRRIAERLEAAYAGRADEAASELAVHFDKGQLPARAAPYFATAGEHAARRYGHVEAVAHFERALALLSAMPEGPERPVLELRASQGLGQSLLKLRGAGAAIPPLERAAALAASLQDHARFAEAVVALQGCLLMRGDLREASEHAPALARLLEQVPDDALRARASQAEILAAIFRGRFAEARRLFEALGLAPEHEEDGGAAGHPRVGPQVGGAAGRAPGALVNGAFVAWLVGRPDTAVRLARLAQQAAEGDGDPYQRAYVLGGWALIHIWRREPVEAAELARRALALAEEASFDVVKQKARRVLEWARAEVEPTPSPEQVDAWTSRSWAVDGVGRTIDASYFAATCLRLGRPDRALEEVTSALAFAEQTDERIVEPELHRLRGEILARTDPAAAERSIRTAIAIARRHSSLALELRAALSLQALCTGADKAAAREDLARLVASFSEGLDTPDLAEARAVVRAGAA
jgi:DNA-binding winged helix-turn-helix (wHTH) protein/tetratricopeptide (TPR) repeat protein